MASSLTARTAESFQLSHDGEGAGPGILDGHNLDRSDPDDGDTGSIWDLPTTMTKLLHFGMPLDEVVRRATAVPAKIMGYEGTVGTLRPGANADISVFELRDDKFELRDSDGDTITTRRRLLTQLTLRDGRVWYERPAE